MSDKTSNLFPVLREGKRWMIITHKFYECIKQQAGNSKKDVGDACMNLEESLLELIREVVREEIRAALYEFQQ